MSQFMNGDIEGLTERKILIHHKQRLQPFSSFDFFCDSISVVV